MMYLRLLLGGATNNHYRPLMQFRPSGGEGRTKKEATEFDLHLSALMSAATSQRGNGDLGNVVDNRSANVADPPHPRLMPHRTARHEGNIKIVRLVWPMVGRKLAAPLLGFNSPASQKLSRVNVQDVDTCGAAARTREDQE